MFECVEYMAFALRLLKVFSWKKKTKTFYCHFPNVTASDSSSGIQDKFLLEGSTQGTGLVSEGGI